MLYSTFIQLENVVNMHKSSRKSIFQRPTKTFEELVTSLFQQSTMGSTNCKPVASLQHEAHSAIIGTLQRPWCQITRIEMPETIFVLVPHNDKIEAYSGPTRQVINGIPFFWIQVLELVLLKPRSCPLYYATSFDHWKTAWSYEMQPGAL